MDPRQQNRRNKKKRELDAKVSDVLDFARVDDYRYITEIAQELGVSHGQVEASIRRLAR